jgi:hypothetical protein
MYVIYTEWIDLLSNAAEGQEVHVQYLLRYDHLSYISSISEIVVTLRGYVDVVHAVRLEVERASMRAKDNTLRRSALEERGMAARMIVERVLRTWGFVPRAGILLVPGLREDLIHYTANHNLWCWEQSDDELHRRLVATVTINQQECNSYRTA